jgi:hypothetical protein
MAFAKKRSGTRGIALSSQAVSLDEGFALIKQKDKEKADKAAAKTKSAETRDAEKTRKDNERAKLSEIELFKVTEDLCT